MNNAIKVENLCIKFEKFGLDNVSFKVPTGSIVGFVGKNGSGKTTTIKSILQIIKCNSADLEIFNNPIDFKCNEPLLPYLNDIGVVFDDNHFPSLMDISTLKIMMSKIYKNWDNELFDHLLKKFGIFYENQLIEKLSKGNACKLSMAVALAHHPKLLILDEPTSNLDPIAKVEMLDLFLDFVQDESHSILYSTHNTDELEKIADYIIMIDEGRVVFEVAKDELIYDYAVIKCSFAQFKQMDKINFVSVIKDDYSVKVLSKNKEYIVENFSQYVIDTTNIAEVMQFYIKGEKLNDGIII